MGSHPCILYDRECIGCGECDRCDLDPSKICDNCMKCIRGEADYRGIRIDGIFVERTPDSDYGIPRETDPSASSH